LKNRGVSRRKTGETTKNGAEWKKKKKRETKPNTKILKGWRGDGVVARARKGRGKTKPDEKKGG